MASIICGNEFYMDYSIWDGTVRRLELFGKTLLDEDTEEDGWREKLWEYAESRNLQVESRHGYRAWVIRLAIDLGKELPSLN